MKPFADQTLQFDQLHEQNQLTSRSFIREISDGTNIQLNQNVWQSLFLEADQANTPNDIPPELIWQHGLNAFLGASIKKEDQENYDTWYRYNWAADKSPEQTISTLHFDGLATLAEVWLNGQHILTSDNMFLQHRVDVSKTITSQNTLYIRACALTPKLNQRKPRPKWRTAFVNNKNLAWFRTSQIGRIPTWSQPPTIVGPWLPIYFEQNFTVNIDHYSAQARVESTSGIIDVEVCISAIHGQKIESITFHAGEYSVALSPAPERSNYFTGTLQIPNVKFWWPHTHGQPNLYNTKLSIQIATKTIVAECDPIGFRTFNWKNLDEALATKGHFEKSFGLKVNGENVFCRGACWTPISVKQTHQSEEQLRAALTQVKQAGINMLRVSGTFYYEQDTFYRLCDEQGILVWQDFMFARLAYPFDDDQFSSQCLKEASQVLQRISARACLAMLCGNTEIEQQTAMLGLPLSEDFHHFFNQTLRELCAQLAPQIAYWPSSPAGGDLPFKVSQGVSHYFGVGGYQQGLHDAALHCPQFASECLAFSNVPENKGLKPFLPDQAGFPTNPSYKQGVPRDVSSGWDFADITDFYIEHLFKVDTRALRYQDPQRYFTLARITSGEIMSKVYGLWRAENSPCNGALIWFLRDLEMGAGWGLIDADGMAKSAYYYLKRIWSPLALWFVDDGLNGVSLHLSHEQPSPLTAELEVTRYTDQGAIAAQKIVPINSEMRIALEWNIEALLDQFFDITHSYRFGPAEYMLVQARLLQTSTIGTTDVLCEAFYYPNHTGLTTSNDPVVETWATPIDDRHYALTITTSNFARAVQINAYPFIAEENYFDLAPNSSKTVTLVTTEQAKTLRGTVSTLNGPKVHSIVIRD